MLVVVIFGQALLGLTVSYALAWLLLLVASPSVAGGAAAFCGVATVVAVAGADGVRRYGPPQALTIPAVAAAFFGIALSKPAVEDASTLGWWFLGAVLGILMGIIVTVGRVR